MTRYIHRLKTGSLDEVDKTICSFELQGWKFIGFLPEEDNHLPTDLIFEWPFNCAPHYPIGF